MKIWIIADTHFYHENIIKFENRPLDNVEQIIANWNKVVADEDLVIHLGDVIFGKDYALSPKYGTERRLRPLGPLEAGGGTPTAAGYAAVE